MTTANSRRQRGSSAGADTPPKVALNLDTATREGDIPDPFVAVVGGKALTFGDPLDCDWQLLRAAYRTGDDYAFLTLVLDEADYEHFLGLTYPAWKMQQLMRKYREHYKVEEQEGEAVASKR
jgi:hypothetical protein